MPSFAAPFLFSWTFSVFAFSKVRTNNTTRNIFLHKAFPLFWVISWGREILGVGRRGVGEPTCPALYPPPAGGISAVTQKLGGMLGSWLLLASPQLSSDGFSFGRQAPGSSCHAPLTWMAPGCGSPICGTTQLSPISWKPSGKDSR